ncbi:hypothetical protein RQP46_010857 [Phenoliferia psychrophenolica]
MSWIRGKSYASTVFSKKGDADANSSLLNLIDHDSHAPRRRIWDRAFTISSLRDYEPAVVARIAQLCEQIDVRKGKAMDANEWLGYLVFDGGTNFLKEGKDSGGIVAGSNEGGEGGSQVSEIAMGADAAQIMAAGADTTRIAVAVVFLFMLRKPELYKRLQSEVDKALKDQHMVTHGDEEFPPHDLLKNIPLMDAYINEALRIHPPLSIEPLRQAPEGGVMIAGVLIPGGTQVRVPSHVIQTDPANYERPNEFDPDRWILQFAYQEMRLFLATLLWKYDMKFAPGFDSYAWEKTIEDNGTLLEIHAPLEVVFTRR